MEIKINKEIHSYKETVYFGLTARQLICSLLAAGTAVGLYFVALRGIRPRDAGIKLTLVNRQLNRQEFSRNLLMVYRQDGRQLYAPRI